MFSFIKLQYEMKKVTEQWVTAQVPRWLTNQQAAQILGGKAI